MKARITLRHILSILIVAELAFATIPVILLNDKTGRENQLIVDNLAKLVIEQLSNDAYFALSGVDNEYFSRQLKNVSNLPMIAGIVLSDSNRKEIIGYGITNETENNIRHYSKELLEETSDTFVNESLANKRLVGYLDVAVHMDTILSTHDKSFFYYALTIGLVFILSIGSLHYVLSVRVMRRASTIVDSLRKRITAPDSLRSLEKEYGDEIGEIAKGIDDVINSLHETEKSRDGFDSSLAKAEEYSDANMASTYLTVTESAASLHTYFSDIHRNVLELLLTQDKESYDNSGIIFSTLDSVSSTIQDLESISQTPSDSHAREVSIANTINNCVKNNDLKLNYQLEEIPDTNCFVDHIRLSRLISKLITVFGRLEGSTTVEMSGDKSLAIIHFRIKSPDRNNIEKPEFFDIKNFLEGNDKIPGRKTKRKLDVLNLSLVLKSINAETTLNWCQQYNKPEILLSIPLELQSPINKPIEQVKTIYLAIVSNETINIPGPYSRASINLKIVHYTFEDDISKELPKFDYVFLDACHYNKAFTIACFLRNSRLFSPTSKIVIILDNEQYSSGRFDDSIFDFVMHKPWRISQLVDTVVAVNELPSRFMGSELL